MNVTLSLYDLVFWLTIFFVLFGATLGLIGVWVEKFWESEQCMRLLLTDVILAVASGLVATIMKFLGN
jgi:hypothetical protein